MPVTSSATPSTTTADLTANLPPVDFGDPLMAHFSRLIDDFVAAQIPTAITYNRSVYTLTLGLGPHTIYLDARSLRELASSLLWLCAPHWSATAGKRA